MRIALFVTCVNDTLYPETGKAVVRLLRRLGHTVVFPEEQTCCGQMHVNSGYDGAGLVERFRTTFSGEDPIVVPSGSCAAMIRESGIPGVYELSELLVDVLGVTDVGAYFPYTVTYHPSCHSLRGLRLGDRPLRLLREVRGLELAELPDAAECCGFGGTFALKNAAVSTSMGTDKARAVLATRADVLCAADNSCLMHLAGILNRRPGTPRIVHLAEILAATDQELP